MARPLSRTARRRIALGLLALALGALHGVALHAIGETLARLAFPPPSPKRLQAVFVRELLPSEPPQIAAVARLPHGPRPVKPLPLPAAASQPAPSREAPTEASQSVAQASSAAASASLEQAPSAASPASAPSTEPATEVLAAASASAASGPASATVTADAAAPAAASGPDAPFEWPPSTRLSYALFGHYRGPVEGSAQVEWIREGLHYQVHLDAIIGLAVAPLFTRRMTSDGRLGTDGLVPERYDEETRRAFGEARRMVVRFGRDEVRLANGEARARWPGVQDSASQFVQLTWLFRTQPALLAVGRTIEVPLALPRSVDRWVYDVVGRETIHAAFGAVEAFHLKPRREPQPGGDMTAEIWFAPSLDYLPVRIRIRQDAESWVEMTIERPPLQAVDPPAPSAAPYSADSQPRRPPR